VPWKGFDILIEVVKELPGWQLIIVGDGPEKNNLENIIKNLELNKRVKLIGAIPREKLLELLSQASIFILNTSFESFSFQVVEAMNAGVPVITTNISNLSEIIKSGREGILVEPNNKNQIIIAIKKIEEDKNFREMIIKNAHDKVQQFSIENTITRLEKLLMAL
jgi:glycosyltransferase involved in cell wall biosynthesis